MLSIILTSYNEPRTIQKAIRCLIDPHHSGIHGNFELITVIPDAKTYKLAKKIITSLGVNKWTHIKDPCKGKPHAINLGLKKAQGDTILLTDGDVYFEKMAVSLLIAHLESADVTGVTGRPVSQDEKTSLFGYWGHLLADAAHHKRMVTMTLDPHSKSLRFVSNKPNFFVMSGYILAFKRQALVVPEDCLIEDAYISYRLFNDGGKLIYAPEAKVYVKYPTNIKDWFHQKLRSVGGYIQLWKYDDIMHKDTKVRNFWKELEYFWFPIRYAASPKEYVWSFSLYPLRLILWLRIFYQQRILKKDLIGDSGWKRVDSTK